MLAPESTIIRSAEARVRALADTMRAVGPDHCTRPVLLAEGYSDHELDIYGPAARQLATNRFVRNLAPVPPELTDEELLDIAVRACGGVVGTAQIVASLRHSNLTPATIARLWPQLMIKLASSVARAPTPSPADIKAFA